MFHCVVVPLDGSPLSESILPYLRRMAFEIPAKVVLVMVDGELPNGASGSRAARGPAATAPAGADAKAYLAEKAG